MIKIKDKKYLRKFPWAPAVSYLIFSYGFFFTSLSDLEKGINEELDLPEEMAGWTFAEIICLAMAYFFNNRALSEEEWPDIFRYLLFSENPDVGQAVYLFVKKNEFFSQSNKEDIYEGGICYLTGTVLEGVNDKHLSNVCCFLEITGLTKKELISSCLTLKNFDPLVLYMQKMKDSLSGI